MKKILLIIIFNLLCCKVVFAEFIEFNKCFRTHIDDKVKWSEKNFKLYTSFLTVEKEIFEKNYKKWGWDKSKDTVKCERKDGKEICNPVDPFEYKLNRADYYIFWDLDEIDRFDKDFLKKIKSIGGEVHSKFDRKSISIDLESGIATELLILSNNYYEVQVDTARKNNEDISWFKKIVKSKFPVIDYADGLLITEGLNDPVGNDKTKIIDLINKTLLTTTYYKNGGILGEAIDICQSKSQNIASEDQPKVSSGTAFFVNKNGNLVTNNHVVKGCKISKIIYENNEYDTSLISTDKTLDLALLKTNIKSKSFITFSNDEPKKRQKIIVAGYPLGKGLSDDLKINDGRISSIKGYQNNSNEITVDIAINPGNSGGPIINEKGQLVGVAVSGLSKDSTEGINFGIKVSALKSFLKSNKIKPEISNLNYSMDDDKILKLLEESTVYTYCEMK